VGVNRPVAAEADPLPLGRRKLLVRHRLRPLVAVLETAGLSYGLALNFGGKPLRASYWTPVGPERHTAADVDRRP
jgi:hypothetical protein